jgi:hypothetical protein
MMVSYRVRDSQMLDDYRRLKSWTAVASIHGVTVKTVKRRIRIELQTRRLT